MIFSALHTPLPFKKLTKAAVEHDTCCTISEAAKQTEVLGLIRDLWGIYETLDHPSALDDEASAELNDNPAQWQLRTLLKGEEKLDNLFDELPSSCGTVRVLHWDFNTKLTMVLGAQNGCEKTLARKGANLRTILKSRIEEEFQGKDGCSMAVMSMADQGAQGGDVMGAADGSAAPGAASAAADLQEAFLDFDKKCSAFSALSSQLAARPPDSELLESLVSQVRPDFLLLHCKAIALQRRPEVEDSADFGKILDEQCDTFYHDYYQLLLYAARALTTASREEILQLCCGDGWSQKLRSEKRDRKRAMRMLFHPDTTKHVWEKLGQSGVELGIAFQRVEETFVWADDDQPAGGSVPAASLSPEDLQHGEEHWAEVIRLQGKGGHFRDLRRVYAQRAGDYWLRAMRAVDALLRQDPGEQVKGLMVLQVQLRLQVAEAYLEQEEELHMQLYLNGGTRLFTKNMPRVPIAADIDNYQQLWSRIRRVQDKWDHRIQRVRAPPQSTAQSTAQSSQPSGGLQLVVAQPQHSFGVRTLATYTQSRRSLEDLTRHDFEQLEQVASELNQNLLIALVPRLSFEEFHQSRFLQAAQVARDVAQRTASLSVYGTGAMATTSAATLGIKVGLLAGALVGGPSGAIAGAAVGAGVGFFVGLLAGIATAVCMLPVVGGFHGIAFMMTRWVDREQEFQEERAAASYNHVLEAQSLYARKDRAGFVQHLASAIPGWQVRWGGRRQGRMLSLSVDPAHPLADPAGDIEFFLHKCHLNPAVAVLIMMEVAECLASGTLRELRVGDEVVLTSGTEMKTAAISLLQLLENQCTEGSGAVWQRAQAVDSSDRKAANQHGGGVAMELSQGSMAELRRMAVDGQGSVVIQRRLPAAVRLPPGLRAGMRMEQVEASSGGSRRVLPKPAHGWSLAEVDKQLVRAPLRLTFKSTWHWQSLLAGFMSTDQAISGECTRMVERTLMSVKITRATILLTRASRRDEVESIQAEELLKEVLRMARNMAIDSPTQNLVWAVQDYFASYTGEPLALEDRRPPLHGSFARCAFAGCLPVCRLVTVRGGVAGSQQSNLASLNVAVTLLRETLLKTGREVELQEQLRQASRALCAMQRNAGGNMCTEETLDAWLRTLRLPVLQRASRSFDGTIEPQGQVGLQPSAARFAVRLLVEPLDRQDSVKLAAVQTFDRLPSLCALLQKEASREEEREPGDGRESLEEGALLWLQNEVLQAADRVRQRSWEHWGDSIKKHQTLSGHLSITSAFTLHCPARCFSEPAIHECVLTYLSSLSELGLHEARIQEIRRLRPFLVLSCPAALCLQQAHGHFLLGQVSEAAGAVHCAKSAKGAGDAGLACWTLRLERSITARVRRDRYSPARPDRFPPRSPMRRRSADPFGLRAPRDPEVGGARQAEEAFVSLSIDGGGSKGIIPAVFLAEIEARTHRPLCTSFGLMAGTSTGSLLTALLTLPESARRPAANIVELYASEVPQLFSGWRRWMFGSLLGDAGRLDGMLDSATRLPGGQRARLGDAQTRVFIPATRSDGVLKRWRSWDQCDSQVRLFDVVRASCAAPGYFTAHTVRDGSGIEMQYVDGGLQANNPAQEAYNEASVQAESEGKKLVLLSLGCGEYPEVHDVDRSTAFWGFHPGSSGLMHSLCSRDSDVNTWLEHRCSAHAGQFEYHRASPVLPKKMDLNVFDGADIASLLDVAEAQVEEAYAAESGWFSRFLERLETTALP